MNAKITELTKRNIFDELINTEGLTWYGRLDDIRFLNRLYKLKELPSNDSRYTDMEGDINQHCLFNNDWGDWWFVGDPRLALYEDDEKFLNFVCEMIHPVVRNNEEETVKLLKLFNDNLAGDGIELTPFKYISGKPIFKAIEIGNNTVIFENIEKIGREFAVEQLNKCEQKVKNGDYDGAITNSRSLIEDIIADIYKTISGGELEKSGDLKEDYKKIKSLLNLSTEKEADNNIKQILRGFVSIIDGIDSLSNKMGDRHRRQVKPERHHAKLCVNSAKIISDLLYDIVDYQFNRRNQLIDKLLLILNSKKSSDLLRYDTFKNYIHSLSYEEIIKEPRVIDFINKLDTYQKRLIIDGLIQNYQINCWDDDSRFFKSLYLLKEYLTLSDKDKIINKLHGNSQAVSFDIFWKEVKL